MSFRLSKPTLLEGRREWHAFFGLALALLLLSTGWHFHRYTQFVSQKKMWTEADVLVQYTKRAKGRSYEVLKLETKEGLRLYTTSREDLKNLQGRSVSVLLFPAKVTFFDYLSIPYIPSVIVRVNAGKSARMKLYERIGSQHESKWMKELYGALFLAVPISKTLRERVTMLGVNHLLALSGFHMGLLWFILYGLLSALYRPLQQRLFPWRHRLLDVGAVTVILLGCYLLLTDMPPSLLRAYAMVVVGWLALLFGIELLSFTFLAVCVVMLAALFPSLLLSVGFWLSVFGVFFIYLFLKWTEEWPKWLVFSVLNIWVYLAMLPIVHLFFGTFALSQLLSPLWTILFTLFYPLAMGLHLLGLGGMADGMLLSLLHWAQGASAVSVQTPLWFALLFVLLSFAALRWRFALYLQMGSAGLFFVYLVEQVA
ncbi:ComEC/Rec2 family competence protein [Hydrogenimonas urashimensis]|uniref:ComEC/Rec2 family competence protein n=1 Tax=Hydrogenimonas urashimensis TaxID=2740515 RepID=UPI0019168781|nr:ComEC/Rec2 family competence protein [Hydrogenimonas urashimensis]